MKAGDIITAKRHGTTITGTVRQHTDVYFTLYGLPPLKLSEWQITNENDSQLE